MGTHPIFESDFDCLTEKTMFGFDYTKLTTGPGFQVVRPSILYAYQEQRESLEVQFTCVDGVQLCSRAVLEMYSDFFSKQLEGRDRFGNRYEFTYAKGAAEYPLKCVKHLLDAMHGIEIKMDTLAEVMMFIKFLRYEAKSDSLFEQKILDMLCGQVERVKLSIQTKLLICVVADTFDNFNGYFEKVFFGKINAETLYGAICTVDLSTDENKQLVALATGDKKTPHQIKCAIHMLAWKMQNAKTIKPLVSRSVLTQTTVHLQIHTKFSQYHGYIRQGDL